MKKKIMAVVLVMAMALSCTGCGEEMIPLTDSEREQIVQFSAHIIGEFNKSQTEGYTALNKRQLQAIYAEDENPSEEQEDQDTSSGEGGTQEQGNAGTESGITTTLTDALGIRGIEARCTEYKVQKDYVQDNVFAMTAAEGNRYIVLTIKIENVTVSSKTCDIAGQNKTFSLNINKGSYTAKALTTFLPNDLGAYNEDIAAGKTKKAVLLFEVPEDTAKNASELSLEVNDGTTKQTILIN